MPSKGNGDPLFQGKGANLIKNRKQVLLALSGGVDSAICAHLLKRQGYHVHGLFIKMTDRSQEEASLSSARKIAKALSISFSVIDKTQAFRRTVIDYFLNTYQTGLTPNPCVVCNPAIKFATLIEVSRGLGIETLATGHYARVKTSKKGKTFLLKGLDKAKDQSYFLHRLDKDLLKRLKFPLGLLSRKRVEKIAAEIGIKSLIQQESQDVCFLRGDYRQYLRRALGTKFERPGPIKTADGTTKGYHNGLSGFTIGQRRGLGIPDARPFYVVRLEPATNTLVIGKEEELFTSRCKVKEINWLVEPSEKMLVSIQVKLRSRHVPANANLKLYTSSGGREGVVYFMKPQRAVTPGQFAVFYKGPLVLGGGTVCR